MRLGATEIPFAVTAVLYLEQNGIQLNILESQGSLVRNTSTSTSIL